MAGTYLACPDFCRRLGCGFRAGCEGRCRSVESHDRYVFWLTGRACPRSIRQHMDDFDAQGKRFGRRNAAASQCTRRLTHKLQYLDQSRGSRRRIDARGEEAEFRAVPINDAKTVKSVIEKFREKYGATDVKKYYSKFDVAVSV